MKNVFNTSSEIVHLFANQSQLSAKSSNTSFAGDTFYSYRTAMAWFIENEAGEKAILINDKRYSNTTSSHQSELRQGTRQFKQFFTMQTNIDLVLEQLKENANKLQNARKPELYIDPSLVLFERFKEYQMWQKGHLPKINGQYLELLDLMRVFHAQMTLSEFNATVTERRNKAITEAKKQRDKNAKTELKKWFNFEIDRVWQQLNDEDYLRISKDGTQIETTQRVKVGIESAKTLYAMIKAGHDIKGTLIDGYTVISLNGHLKIGCHNINVKNMKEIGEKILAL